VARSVTISKAGVLLGTFTVPQGTLLSVTSGTVGSILPATDGRFEFHDDVEIRAQPASRRTRTIQLQDAMLQSPVLLKSKDVDVVIVRQP